MAWRRAHSLDRLLEQVNELYPTRSRISDGTIGDAAHAAVASDHNPNSAGVVCATDITHSPQSGFDAHALADRLRAKRHPNLKYIISNRRIAGDWTGWNWHPYSGSNPHDKHIHVSVGVGPDGRSAQPYDDRTDWTVREAAPALGKTIDQIANEVLAGQWGNGTERITRLKQAGYDPAQVQAAVNAKLGGGGAAPRKSNEVIAAEVLAGAWGNGEDRKRALQAAGYNYDAVQAIVNAKTAPARLSVSQLADQVIAGAWGSGTDRKARLTAAGYDYNAVQNEVNKKLGYGSPSLKSNETIANEVIAGYWSSGDKRRELLTAAGYNYSTIQSIVNRKLGY